MSIEHSTSTAVNSNPGLAFLLRDLKHIVVNEVLNGFIVVKNFQEQKVAVTADEASYIVLEWLKKDDAKIES